MSEAGIARAAGWDKPKVAAYLTVARSETAAKAVDRWEFLTLDQAATLAEFESDQEALTALVQAAKHNPAQFDHLVAKFRATRDERETKAAFVAELEAQGFAIYGDRPHVPWQFDLENLRDGDGNPITPEAHATCPGRTVTIAYEWGWAPGAEAAYRAAHDLPDDEDLADIEFDSDEEAREAGFVPRWQIGRHLCTDPEQYGHANVYDTPGETPTKEQATAEDEDSRGGRAQGRGAPPRPAAEHRLAGRNRGPHVPARTVLARKAPPAGALPCSPRPSRGRDQAGDVLLRPPGRRRPARHRAARSGQRAADREHASAALARASELAMVLGPARPGSSGADGQEAETWRKAEGRSGRREGKLPQQAVTWPGSPSTPATACPTSRPRSSPAPPLARRTGRRGRGRAGRGPSRRRTSTRRRAPARTRPRPTRPTPRQAPKPTNRASRHARPAFPTGRAFAQLDLFGGTA